MEVPDDPIIRQMECTGEYHDTYENRMKGYDSLRSYQYLALKGDKENENESRQDHY